MMHRASRRGAVLAAVAAFSVSVAAPAAGLAAAANGGEDTRTAQAFIEGLRERGYHDLAAEYLGQVRKQPDAPKDLVATADYELGRLLLDEASKTGDLIRRKDLLDQARVKLDAFTKANPNHPRASEALVELARLLVERGHLAMLQAGELDEKDKVGKDAKLDEARGSFDQARTAYDAAAVKLKAAFEKYPKTYIADAGVRREKEQVHNALMQARLQRAVVDYEQAESYPEKSKERADLMGKALTQFEQLYKDYRTQLAGLTARMWMGKCYEERGDLGPAMGIYNELMEHSAPELRPLQRFVGYFRIIVLGKRKEYALAADEAVRWMKANNSPAALRSKEGLGVQLELAKNIIAQLPGIKNESAKSAAVKQVTETLGHVVRYSSPFKAEAIDLLKKYKPSVALRAEDVAHLNYDDAMAQGEQALAAHEWPRATALLRQAVRRAEALRDVDKTNYARYNLAFCYYMDKRYYDALVIADHLARRYPRGGLSPKAAEIGMASLAEAYNLYREVDRTSDLNALIDLARYMVETYPEAEQGDTARLTLGQIYHGTGQYPKAIEALGAVRPASSKYNDARTRLGASYWEQSKVLRNAGKAAEADAEVARAVDTLKAALKSREDARTPPTDPALLSNACDLADIYLETSRPGDALKLLDPLVKKQTARSGPAFNRLMADMLRAHIGNNQVDQAMADMAALEKAGGSGSGLTQLYFGLGKLLEKEMDSLKKKGDSAGLNRTQSAYLKFLTALAKSKSGQTYESLQWAGENMLKLEKPVEAEGVFQQVLKTYETDKAFLDTPGSGDRLLRTRLKLAAALRGQGKFGEAGSLVEQLVKENPRTIEPLMERGMLLEDEAAAKKASWDDAYNQWRTIAARLGRARVKPAEYFDAWYHAAFCLNRAGKPTEARQALNLVKRLSARSLNPEMKQKYDDLLAQIK